eukprot:Em0012g672a
MERAQFYLLLCTAVTIYASQDSCDRRPDGDIVCETYGESVSIPCARFLLSSDKHYYSYYVKENSTWIAREGPGTLHVAVAMGDNGHRICCHQALQHHAEVCFKLSVLRPPVEVPLVWSPGYSSVPVVGQPFGLTCPLEGNPPLTYTWERYPTIDRQSPPLPLPPTLTFGAGGHSWEVDSFSAQENGFYVCKGSNALGSHSYVNVRHFYLNADKCSQHYQRSANILITGGSPHHHAPLGSTLTLHCTVTPVQRLRPGRPQWWRVRSGDGRDEEEDLPLVTTVQDSYDGETCTWHTSLVIPSVSHETTGQYFCGLDRLKENITVSIKETKSGPSVSLCIGTLLILVSAACVWILSSTQLSHVLGGVAQWAYQEPEATGYLYDVFISSHVEASELAHDQLFKGLEAWSPRGYRVCWHERDFLTGATILQNISEAVQSSRKVVVVLSKRYMESQFCRMELDLALHRMHSSRTRCLIPIALGEGCVPDELKGKITYWPLREAVVKSEEGGREELLRKLTSLIGDPIEVKRSPVCSHG